MNRRVINSIISKKVKGWLKTIDGAVFRSALEGNVIVTGGCIASMLLKEKVNDYDIYFRNKDACRAAALYYSAFFPGAEIKDEGEDERIRIHIPSEGVKKRKPTEDGGKHQPVYISDNAVTLTNKVQVIFRFYGEPEEIHKNYDFVHCTNYWTEAGGLVLRPAALESLLAKQLQYVGSKYPLCSIIRIRKFVKRGWYINAGQMLKIMFQISELDLSDVDTLKEQLVGVDTAYFDLLIEALKKKAEGDGEFKVTQPYVAEIVDRIFG